MYVVVVQKFTFAISSPDEFLFCNWQYSLVAIGLLMDQVLLPITVSVKIAHIITKYAIVLHFSSAAPPNFLTWIYEYLWTNRLVSSCQ